MIRLANGTRSCAAAENIDQTQKARNSEDHCNGAREVGQPIGDEAHPRGRLMSVANPWGPSLRGCNRIRPGRGAFVNWQPASPSGSAAHGHSITDYGSNVFHLLLAETVEAKG